MNYIYIENQTRNNNDEGWSLEPRHIAATYMVINNIYTLPAQLFSAAECRDNIIEHEHYVDS